MWFLYTVVWVTVFSRDLIFISRPFAVFLNLHILLFCKEFNNYSSTAIKAKQTNWRDFLCCLNSQEMELWLATCQTVVKRMMDGLGVVLQVPPSQC